MRNVARHSSKKVPIGIAIAVAVLILGIGMVSFVRSLQNTPTPNAESSSSETQKESGETGSEAASTETPTQSDTTPDQVKVGDDDKEAASLDPATVRSVVVAPMGIEVSYVESASNFMFFVQRTPRGTQYVEFSNEDFKGTKCTNDTGVFASIIEKPEANEAAALTKTVSVDGTTYGLSLAAPTCAPDVAQLKAYQDAFSQAFPLLKTAPAGAAASTSESGE